jgi:putative ABC transport system substrate-binding protein
MQLSTIGFLLTFTASILAAPVAAEEPPSTTVSRIGVLLASSGPSLVLDLLRQNLRGLGYVEGQNLAVEERYAGGKDEILPDLASELVQREVEVIVAVGYGAVRAAKQATPTIPIVMLVGGDPVGSGLITSLARPGGNVTGLAALSSKLSAQRLALLKEVIPTVTHVAVLYNPDDVTKTLDLLQTGVTARALGVTLHPAAVRDPAGFEPAFAALLQARARALITFGDVFTLRHRAEIVDFAAKHQLPAMYELRAFVQAGGLMAYGPRLADMVQQIALYVDRLLKGAKPADLPVEEPTTFDLVINLKTAQALDLTIPLSVLSRANEVIQ